MTRQLESGGKQRWRGGPSYSRRNEEESGWIEIEGRRCLVERVIPPACVEIEGNRDSRAGYRWKRIVSSFTLSSRGRDVEEGKDPPPGVEVEGES
jgi:hypothetical protein